MEDERFKEEMIRMIGTVIQKLDGHDARFDNLEKDVSEIKSVQKEHSTILKEHTQILNRVDSKTDSIAEKVLEQEVRIAKAEQNIEDLQGGVH
jgi:septal ring factor EnvC (AmiA/AmiB activator)